MSDDRFDEFLQRAARSYHEPPATPREDMWARIESERRTRRLAVPARRRGWWITASALAATLLLGIGIGTWMERGTGRAGPLPPAVALGPSATSAPSATTPATAASTPTSPATGRAAPNNAGRITFDAAAADHLGRAEALLTTFNTESAHGAVDPQIGAWAGDLLTTTRLLLDSPRARDPQTRKLLSDLEVVLAQIAQLRSQPDSPSDELEIIKQAVRSQNMMTRLRDATPAGSVAPASGS